MTKTFRLDGRTLTFKASDADYQKMIDNNKIRQEKIERKIKKQKLEEMK